MTPHACLRLSCRYSFIGKGDIWPEPEVEIRCTAFAGADTSKRWLHPHIYEWPEDGKDRSDAGLCIMDWREGPASDVIPGLRRQWARARDRYSIERSRFGPSSSMFTKCHCRVCS